MSTEEFSARLPDLLREIRYYNETVDYAVLFHDETAEASLQEAPEWVAQLDALLKPVVSEQQLKLVEKHVSKLLKAGDLLIAERHADGFVMEDGFREMAETREQLFESISEASPARAGGLAASVVHEYRSWADELVILYYFAPDDEELTDKHELAREHLVRWIDELPHIISEKISIQEILDADEDLYRTAHIRLQERIDGRMPSDAAYENIATIRERLLDRLIDLQILVSQHNTTADTPLVVGNRRRLEADLHAEIARFARHEDQVFTLVICVVDRIKVMRTKLGQEIIDKIMRQAAGLLQESLRPYDKVYAAGGGKLALLLPNSRAHGGFEAARRCRDILKSKPFSIGNKKNIKISASFGLSECRAGEDWQGLYDSAYQALTHAKTKGNSQCCARIDGQFIFDEISGNPQETDTPRKSTETGKDTPA